jgi:hypothetical protein
MASVTTPSHSGDKITLFINDNLVFDSSSGASALPVSLSAVDSTFYTLPLSEQTQIEDRVPIVGKQYTYLDPNTKTKYNLGIFISSDFSERHEDTRQGSIEFRNYFIKLILNFTNNIFIRQNTKIYDEDQPKVNLPTSLSNYLQMKPESDFAELLKNIYNFNPTKDGQLEINIKLKGGSLYRKTKKFNKSNKTKKSRKSNKIKKH